MSERWRRIAYLALLYLVQGLPFGFQTSALPAYLRERGVSLTHIGLAGALALPWSIKALWAPFVDRHGSARIGRRRSWILPMQALLAGAMIVAALVPIDESVMPLLWLVLAMNLFAATMDIAVDGLAVDVLRDEELGHGNAAQVIGYRAGMLLGGGVLVWASARIGWTGLFFAMAAVVIAVLITTLLVPERRSKHAESGARGTLREVLRALREAMRAPGTGPAILLVMTYKMGESVIDPMFSPFLLDHGMTRDRIGLWVGSVGMGAGIAGSLLGGWLATRASSLVLALAIAGAARIVPLLAQLALAILDIAPEPAVAVITTAEHLTSSALTTVMFAFMMSRTDPRIGATHYTALATLEVIGKAPLSLASGAIADGIGYPGTFGLGVALAIAWTALAHTLSPALHTPRATA